MQHGSLLIRNARLLPPVEQAAHGAVVIRGGRIVALEGSGYHGDFDGTVIDAGGMLLTPGLVDVHVHGAAGHDTMDATPQALDGMARFYAVHGVTGFLATTMTAGHAGTVRAVENAARYRSEGGARLLGVHLEGPYLSPKWPGAQPREHIRPAAAAEYQQLFAFGNVRLITLAPEIEANQQLLRYARDNGARVSLGHTDADYEQVLAAVELGADHMTHTFNAMRGIHHRQPGGAGAALTNPALFAELIADGVHVHPAVAGLLLHAKGAARAVLITDAMRAAGLSDGAYELGGQPVNVSQGIARLADGTLAGSTLTLDRAVRNVVSWSGVSVADAIAMASSTPARSVGLESEAGELRPGRWADLVLWDQRLNVRLTMVQGRVVYKREENESANTRE